MLPRPPVAHHVGMTAAITNLLRSSSFAWKSRARDSISRRAIASSSTPDAPSNRLQEWWRWWTSAPAVEPARFSGAWWWDKAVIFTVFGVTGSSAVVLARPVTQSLGIQGSMRDGPWSYRIGYFCAMTPLYSAILLFNGTLAGRQYFFKKVVTRMWSHLLPLKTIQRLLTPKK